MAADLGPDWTRKSQFREMEGIVSEATVNGFRMYYETHGSGTALAMIHGGLGGGEGCAQMMEHHAATLSDRFQVISYDRRAAGRSETPADGYSIPNYANDLHVLLGHLGVNRPGSFDGIVKTIQSYLDIQDQLKPAHELVYALMTCREMGQSD
ncbi:Soluble epoxide hydrolase [Geodia barretti]|uniref:Soluble epoxide hydrolase n=1 Tax=Geodia barretti TaxID=519541 RepID=A0AA35SQ04_GEOBA|nr:Soluble epoxide hydrolase [Geodia barretti]